MSLLLSKVNPPATFRFEPRDRYRYSSHDDARRAAHCFLELMKRLERSRMKLSVLAELGLLKFPQETFRQHELWLIVALSRDTCDIGHEVKICKDRRLAQNVSPSSSTLECQSCSLIQCLWRGFKVD